MVMLKKKRVFLALWFVYSSCVLRLFFIGLSFWEASSPLSSESILGTETSLKHPSQCIRHELEK